MAFVGPKDPNDGTKAKKMDWLRPGQMMGTFSFDDATLVQTLSFGIAPSNLTGYMVSGFVGDDSYEDDIFSLEQLETPLHQVSPAKRWLSVYLMPREKDGKEFKFYLSLFSDNTGFANQDYEFLSKGRPIGLRIPVKFV